MKKVLLLFWVLCCLGVLACQKKTEPNVEEMGDPSSVKIMTATQINSIPQIPQSLPASLPSKPESLPSTLPASNSVKSLDSQPATW